MNTFYIIVLLGETQLEPLPELLLFNDIFKLISLRKYDLFLKIN